MITLEERVSRCVVLGHVPARHTSKEIFTALHKAVAGIDKAICSSITCDQGSEMAGHNFFHGH
ncbi:hypothetical protein [Corynebacterium propinquum]